MAEGNRIVTVVVRSRQGTLQCLLDVLALVGNPPAPALPVAIQAQAAFTRLLSVTITTSLLKVVSRLLPAVPDLVSGCRCQSGRPSLQTTLREHIARSCMPGVCYSSLSVTG